MAATSKAFKTVTKLTKKHKQCQELLNEKSIFSLEIKQQKQYFCWVTAIIKEGYGNYKATKQSTPEQAILFLDLVANYQVGLLFYELKQSRESKSVSNQPDAKLSHLPSCGGEEAYFFALKHLLNLVPSSNSVLAERLLLNNHNNNPKALLLLFIIYSFGINDTANKKKALEYLEKAAEKGYMPAVNLLGNHLNYSQDHANAIKWFKQAASKGYPASIANLEKVYLFGNGVEKNPLEACKYLLLYSHFKNSSFKLNEYGWNFLHAKEGFPKDEKRAVELFKAAMHGGNIMAQVNLAHCYSLGLGLKKNFLHGNNYADRAFSCAIEKKDSPALYHLGLWFMEKEALEQGNKKAFNCFKIASELGNGDATDQLAHCYIFGKGVDTDYKKSFKIVSKRAEEGSIMSLSNLAELYENGMGVSEDQRKAARLYHIAADKNWQPAINKLKEERYSIMGATLYEIHNALHTADECKLKELLLAPRYSYLPDYQIEELHWYFTEGLTKLTNNKEARQVAEHVFFNFFKIESYFCYTDSFYEVMAISDLLLESEYFFRI